MRALYLVSKSNVKKLLCLIWISGNLLFAQSYTKYFGVSGIDDGPTCIVPTENGFLIAGYEYEEIFLLETDLLGNILWKKKYDITEHPDYVTDINISKGGLLYGCGYGRHGATNQFQDFYFTYDIEKQSFLWLRSSGLSVKPANIHQFGNDYIITGDESYNSVFGLLLMKVNAATGDVEKYTSYYLSGRESAAHSLLLDGTLYTGGRYGLQRKEDKYRGAISQFNMSFQEIWSKYYITSRDRYARNYLAKIRFNGKNLVAAFFTNNLGISKEYTISLAEMSLSGELMWANEYTIDGYTSLTVRDLAVLPDGYIVYGYTDQPQKDVFIMKINREGDLVWTRIYGGLYNDLVLLDAGKYIAVKEDRVYCIAQSQNITIEHDYSSMLISVELSEAAAQYPCVRANPKTDMFKYINPIEGKIQLSPYDTLPVSKEIKFQESPVLWNIDQYDCYPYLAMDDYDTLPYGEKQRQINVLRNDPGYQNNLLHQIVLLNDAEHGRVSFVDSIILYEINQQEEIGCVTDHFHYVMDAGQYGIDTATVYITALRKDSTLEKDQIILSLEGETMLDAKKAVNTTGFLWNTGDTTQQIAVTSAGKYTVYRKDGSCLYTQTYLVQDNPYSFSDVPNNNVVLLVDISLSMTEKERLPLLSQTLFHLITFMREEDKISLITYADTAEIVLDGVSARQQTQIQEGFNQILPHGKTNIVFGIEKAVAVLSDHYEEDRNNRIILMTDGKIFSTEKEWLIEQLKEQLPPTAQFSIFLFNQSDVLYTQMLSLTRKVDGKVYSILPENIEESLLREFKSAE